MNGNQSQSRSERWFARQLREAARDERPEFSESLADRVMQAIRPSVAVRSPRRRYWQIAAWISAAAAIIAIAFAGHWLIGLTTHDSANEPNIAIVQPADISPVQNRPNSTAVRTSLAANYTLDDLSRDAKATAHLLVDQLPFETPADDWGL